MKIWFDVTNTPHVNVLLPIFNYISQNHNLIISARDFSETVPLLKNNNISPLLYGDYKGKSRYKKSLGMISRIYKLHKNIPPFDISFSLGGNYTATISKLRSKPSITFSDNDISFKAPAFRFGSHFIFPNYFDCNKLKGKYKIRDDQIYKFNGFKEDIYIADYKPDTSFLDNLPFNDFITIRPENLKASYVPLNSKTIVPELFNIFRNENILFLPRYDEEKEYANGYDNIFIPDGPLNGLDVCYYTKAMLTGAGTFAREAAIMGTPSVSFFPGKTFLTVDKIMQEQGWEFKSREPKEIYEYVENAEKRSFQIERSKKVQNEVLSILDKIINSI